MPGFEPITLSVVAAGHLRSFERWSDAKHEPEDVTPELKAKLYRECITHAGLLSADVRALLAALRAAEGDRDRLAGEAAARSAAVAATEADARRFRFCESYAYEWDGDCGRLYTAEGEHLSGTKGMREAVDRAIAAREAVEREDGEPVGSWDDLPDALRAPAGSGAGGPRP